MLTDLKPCPFCGAQPEAPDVGDYFVECPSCGVQGPISNEDGQPHAMEEWNRRVIEAEDLQSCSAQNAIHAPQDTLQSADATQAQEPVSREFQGSDGKWYPFIDEHHYKATAEDGSWPIRYLYTAPQPPAPCPETEQILKALDLDIQVNTLQAKVVGLEKEVVVQSYWGKRWEDEHAKVVEQSAMIEKCYSSFDLIVSMPKSHEATRLAAQALAAIAAHRGQHSELAAQCSELLPKCSELERDAARYRLVRRGQHWSVIDGIGDTLRAEGLDEAVDDVIAEAKP